MHILIGSIVVGCIFLFYAHKLHYEYAINKLRQVPYKQRSAILNELLSIVYGVSNKIGVKPFLIYGTLLGYVRQKDFICYDFDIDIGIFTHEYDYLYNVICDVITDYPEYKISIRSFLGYRQFVIRHKLTGINADISEFILQSDGTIIRNVPKLYSLYVLKERSHVYPKSWILPERQVKFKNQTVYIPHDPNALLETYYGSDFLIPDHICNKTCTKCIKK